MAEVKEEDHTDKANTSVVSGNEAGGWWGSFVTAARSKSFEVFEFVKRDLDEISSAVKNEATAVVSNTASAVKETLQLDSPDSTVGNVKRSFSTFLDQVSNALNPLPDDGDEEAILIQGGTTVMLTRLQTRLHGIYSDAETFTKEIEPEHEAAFEAWLANLEDHHLANERLTKLLVANPVLQHNYETLVPSQVTHAQFWKRLLFRKALIEDSEAARERKQERERAVAESFQWDKESFSNHIELSEEEQIRLLQEYENEKNGIVEPATGKVADKLDKLIEDCKEDVENLNVFVKEKKDFIIVTKEQSKEQASSGNSTSSGDKESNDDEWEKDFDLEENESSSK
ncbi:BSD domain-containing protein 1 isoform X2 [Nilaparvata lugens]|uniref:BSD domain-containing protein 1 isoform X2 n=1 Tax=Nilaparvata lugens TaxID=108931 RepID=UPI000B986BD2|nr:BSD domain-containing protein 1 isoform X2 [Nilaparvata lugens]